MISSVARNYNWASPFIINEMYVDDIDHLGLEFWYKDLVLMQKKQK